MANSASVTGPSTFLVHPASSLPMSLHVIVPELPPALGGVADYASTLARHWPGPAPAAWWLAQGAPAASRALPSTPIFPLSASGLLSPPSPLLPKISPAPQSICQSLPDNFSAASATTLFVHYTQYGYPSAGVPWRLVLGLRRWRASSPRRRLAVFFHETWLSGPLWRRRGLVAPAARLVARALAAAADVSATNCTRHARQLSSSPIPVLPVPANIPVSTPRHTAFPAPGQPLRVVVFGLPETRLNTLRAHHAFLAWLVAQNALADLTLLGAGSPVDRFGRAATALATSLAGPRLRQITSRPPSEISAELTRADLGLSAYSAGEVGKSGTLAALFTHGCTVGCSGHDASGLALDLSLAPGGTPRDWPLLADPAARTARRQRVATYAADALSWPAHAARLANLIPPP